MTLIQPPLKPRDKGPLVVHLQEGLLFLLNRKPGVFVARTIATVPPDPVQRAAELIPKITGEMATGTFDGATVEAVNFFQDANGVGTGGAVDGPTADELNRVLKDLGAFENAPAAETGVKELSLGMNGGRLGEVQKGLGQLGYSIPENELAGATFGAGTQSAIRRFQGAMDLTVTGRADERTLSELARELAEQGGAIWRVEGRLYQQHGGPAVGVSLHFRQTLFGGETRLLDAGKVKSDAMGNYLATYTPQSEPVILTVLVLLAGGKEVALSNPVTAKRREVLNLVVPTELQPAADSEFNRLAAALRPHLGTRRLAEAREDDERSDLALLHQTTGWDARVLALAAHADRVAAEPEVMEAGLGGEALYALVRAGLPADSARLAMQSEETVEAALMKATEAGIVQLAAGDIAREKAAFAAFADKKRLTLRAPGAFSNTGEMLQSAGLGDAEQTIFTRAYASHLSTGADLWAEAQRGGLPEAQISKLQLQGKLAFLTHNHLPLVEALTKKMPALSADDLSALVDEDFHEAATWKSVFTEVAGGGTEAKLKKVRPPAYAGETAAEAVDAASEDFARQVRLSYPTQVARRLVEKDATANRLGLKIEGQRTSVHEALRRAQGLKGGFELGRESVDGFIKRNQAELFPREKEEEIEATRKGWRTLQRVYQIAPTAKAMTSLLSLGFKSARDVTRFKKEDFLRNYAHHFKTPEEAALIHSKATQVAAVAFHFLTMVQQVQNAVPTAATHRAAPSTDVEGRVP